MELRPRDVLSPANLGLLALAILVAVLAYFALFRTPAPPTSTETLRPATAAPSPSPSPSPEAGPTTVAVIGDEMSAGVGAPGRTYADLLAAERDWTLQGFSVPDSGYLAPPAFADRVADVAAAGPDVVVLQGGANDLGQGDAATAAADVIEQLRAQLPSTRIVLLAPLATGGPQMEAVRESLREVARTSRVHFVDGSDAFAAEPAAAAADGGLTDQAHAALAAALVDDFELLRI